MAIIIARFRAENNQFFVLFRMRKRKQGKVSGGRLYVDGAKYYCEGVKAIKG